MPCHAMPSSLRCSAGAGIRDHGLLESALARAPNKHADGEDDLAVVAAAYAFDVSTATSGLPLLA